jgi:hypothetical protein
MAATAERSTSVTGPQTVLSPNPVTSTPAGPQTVSSQTPDTPPTPAGPQSFSSQTGVSPPTPAGPQSFSSQTGVSPPTPTGPQSFSSQTGVSPPTPTGSQTVSLPNDVTSRTSTGHPGDDPFVPNLPTSELEQLPSQIHIWDAAQAKAGIQASLQNTPVHGSPAFSQQNLTGKHVILYKSGSSVAGFSLSIEDCFNYVGFGTPAVVYYLEANEPKITQDIQQQPMELRPVASMFDLLKVVNKGEISFVIDYPPPQKIYTHSDIIFFASMIAYPGIGIIQASENRSYSPKYLGNALSIVQPMYTQNKLEKERNFLTILGKITKNLEHKINPALLESGEAIKAVFENPEEASRDFDKIIDKLVEMSIASQSDFKEIKKTICMTKGKPNEFTPVCDAVTFSENPDLQHYITWLRHTQTIFQEAAKTPDGSINYMVDVQRFFDDTSKTNIDDDIVTHPLTYELYETNKRCEIFKKVGKANRPKVTKKSTSESDANKAQNAQYSGIARSGKEAPKEVPSASLMRAFAAIRWDIKHNTKEGDATDIATRFEGYLSGSEQYKRMSELKNDASKIEQIIALKRYLLKRDVLMGKYTKGQSYVHFIDPDSLNKAIEEQLEGNFQENKEVVLYKTKKGLQDILDALVYELNDHNADGDIFVPPSTMFTKTLAQKIKNGDFGNFTDVQATSDVSGDRVGKDVHPEMLNETHWGLSKMDINSPYSLLLQHTAISTITTIDQKIINFMNTHVSQLLTSNMYLDQVVIEILKDLCSKHVDDTKKIDENIKQHNYIPVKFELRPTKEYDPKRYKAIFNKIKVPKGDEYASFLKALITKHISADHIKHPIRGYKYGLVIKSALDELSDMIVNEGDTRSDFINYLNLGEEGGKDEFHAHERPIRVLKNLKIVINGSTNDKLKNTFGTFIDNFVIFVDSPQVKTVCEQTTEEGKQTCRFITHNVHEMYRSLQKANVLTVLNTYEFKYVDEWFKMYLPKHPDGMSAQLQKGGRRLFSKKDPSPPVATPNIDEVYNKYINDTFVTSLDMVKASDTLDLIGEGLNQLVVSIPTGNTEQKKVITDRLLVVNTKHERIFKNVKTTDGITILPEVKQQQTNILDNSRIEEVDILLTKLDELTNLSKLLSEEANYVINDDFDANNVIIFYDTVISLIQLYETHTLKSMNEKRFDEVMKKIDTLVQYYYQSYLKYSEQYKVKKDEDKQDEDHIIQDKVKSLWVATVMLARLGRCMAMKLDITETLSELTSDSFTNDKHESLEKIIELHRTLDEFQFYFLLVSDMKTLTDVLTTKIEELRRYINTTITEQKQITLLVNTIVSLLDIKNLIAPVTISADDLKFLEKYGKKLKVYKNTKPATPGAPVSEAQKATPAVPGISAQSGKNITENSDISAIKTIDGILESSFKQSSKSLQQNLSELKSKQKEYVEIHKYSFNIPESGIDLNIVDLSSVLQIDDLLNIIYNEYFKKNKLHESMQSQIKTKLDEILRKKHKSYFINEDTKDKLKTYFYESLKHAYNVEGSTKDSIEGSTKGTTANLTPTQSVSKCIMSTFKLEDIMRQGGGEEEYIILDGYNIVEPFIILLNNIIYNVNDKKITALFQVVKTIINIFAPISSNSNPDENNKQIGRKISDDVFIDGFTDVTTNDFATKMFIDHNLGPILVSEGSIPTVKIVHDVNGITYEIIFESTKLLLHYFKEKLHKKLPTSTNTTLAKSAVEPGASASTTPAAKEQAAASTTQVAQAASITPAAQKEAEEKATAVTPVAPTPEASAAQDVLKLHNELSTITDKNNIDVYPQSDINSHELETVQTYSYQNETLQCFHDKFNNIKNAINIPQTYREYGNDEEDYLNYLSNCKQNIKESPFEITENDKKEFEKLFNDILYFVQLKTKTTDNAYSVATFILSTLQLTDILAKDSTTKYKKNDIHNVIQPYKTLLDTIIKSYDGFINGSVIKHCFILITDMITYCCADLFVNPQSQSSDDDNTISVSSVPAQNIENLTFNDTATTTDYVTQLFVQGKLGEILINDGYNNVFERKSHRQIEIVHDVTKRLLHYFKNKLDVLVEQGTTAPSMKKGGSPSNVDNRVNSLISHIYNTIIKDIIASNRKKFDSLIRTSLKSQRDMMGSMIIPVFAYNVGPEPRAETEDGGEESVKDADDEAAEKQEKKIKWIEDIKSAYKAHGVQKTMLELQGVDQPLDHTGAYIRMNNFCKKASDILIESVQIPSMKTDPTIALYQGLDEFFAKVKAKGPVVSNVEKVCILIFTLLSYKESLAFDIKGKEMKRYLKDNPFLIALFSKFVFEKVLQSIQSQCEKTVVKDRELIDDVIEMYQMYDEKMNDDNTTGKVLRVLESYDGYVEACKGGGGDTDIARTIKKEVLEVLKDVFSKSRVRDITDKLRLVDKNTIQQLLESMGLSMKTPLVQYSNTDQDEEEGGAYGGAPKFIEKTAEVAKTLTRGVAEGVKTAATATKEGVKKAATATKEGVKKAATATKEGFKKAATATAKGTVGLTSSASSVLGKAASAATALPKRLVQGTSRQMSFGYQILKKTLQKLSMYPEDSIERKMQILLGPYFLDIEQNLKNSNVAAQSKAEPLKDDIIRSIYLSAYGIGPNNQSPDMKKFIGSGGSLFKVFKKDKETEKGAATQLVDNVINTIKNDSLWTAPTGFPGVAQGVAQGFPATGLPVVNPKGDPVDPERDPSADKQPAPTTTPPPASPPMSQMSPPMSQMSPDQLFSSKQPLNNIYTDTSMGRATQNIMQNRAPDRMPDRMPDRTLQGDDPTKLSVERMVKSNLLQKGTSEKEMLEHLQAIEDFVEFMRNKAEKWQNDILGVVNREYTQGIKSKLENLENGTPDQQKADKALAKRFLYKFASLVSKKSTSYYQFIKNFYMKESRRKVKHIIQYLKDYSKFADPAFRDKNRPPDYDSIVRTGLHTPESLRYQRVLEEYDKYKNIETKFLSLNKTYDTINDDFYNKLIGATETILGGSNLMKMDDDIRIYLTSVADRSVKHMNSYKGKLKSYYRLNYSMADVLFDTQFIILYVIKAIRIGFTYLALFLATKIFAPMYEETVYDKKTNPPSLMKYLLLFIAFDVSFNVFLIVVLFLLKFLFKTDDNAFVIDRYLFYKYLIDYAVSLTLLFALASLISIVITNKKYFKYKYEGLRAIRAFQEMIFYMSIIVYIFPYFWVF